MPGVVCLTDVFQNDRSNERHELRDRGLTGKHRGERFEKGVQRAVRIEISLLEMCSTDEERLKHLLKENDPILLRDDPKDLRENVDEQLMGELIDRRRVRGVKKLENRFEQIHRFGLNGGEIL